MTDIRGLVLLNPLLGRENYVNKVVEYDPIAYWPLLETSGTTATDYSGNSRDGTYSGVSLANALGPDGRNKCPYFDGADDTVDIYSAGFNTDFSGAEGTISGWAKVAAARWTDAQVRRALLLEVDSDNYVQIQKSSTNNVLTFHYKAGGTMEDSQYTTSGPTAWFHWAMSWSATGNIVRYYFNGRQTDTMTALGTWAGNFDANQTLIGASQVATPTDEWLGWLAHIAVFDSVLSAPAIADLAAV